MASRRTRFTVYVDKDIMTKPTELFDAVLAHFIKTGMDIAERKVFLAGFMKIAGVDELNPKRIEFIDKWVLVRDVKTFPFRHNKKEGTDEDTGIEGGVSVDDGADEEPESGATSE